MLRVIHCLVSICFQTIKISFISKLFYVKRSVSHFVCFWQPNDFLLVKQFHHSSCNRQKKSFNNKKIPPLLHFGLLLLLPLELFISETNTFQNEFAKNKIGFHKTKKTKKKVELLWDSFKQLVLSLRRLTFYRKKMKY